jgi:hypothetical protein
VSDAADRPDFSQDDATKLTPALPCYEARPDPGSAADFLGNFTFTADDDRAAEVKCKNASSAFTSVTTFRRAPNSFQSPPHLL